MEQTQMKIPSDEVQSMIRKYGKHAVVRGISFLISHYKLEFPYKRHYIGDDTVIRAKFDNLVRFRATIDEREYHIPVLSLRTSLLKPFHFRGHFALIPSLKTEYEDMNILSDYFQEDARVRSVAGYGVRSVMDHWLDPNLNKVWISRLLNRPGGSPIDSFELREALYETVKTEPSTFKTTVASAIIRLFNGKRVLDFCAGWGDRLIGALSCQDILDLYVGVDPNQQLFEGYNKMKEAFAAPECKDKYCLINAPFESCVLPEHARSFDLVFTGPPYFDYEKYGDGSHQSTTTYPIPTDWTVDFLFACIEKAWGMLCDGGFMALNVNDVQSLSRRGITFAEAMNLFIMSRLDGAVYEGVISFAGANAFLPRPIWVYKKDKATQNKAQSTSQQADRALQDHYKAIYDRMLLSKK